MNKLLTISLLLLLFCSTGLYSQDIQVIYHETELYDTLGSEMVFDMEVINISQQNQVVFEVRSVNSLPTGWFSGLCFGDNCFAPHIDSIATIAGPPFNTPELEPGDTLLTSVHVFALENHGTANVEIQIGTFRNPGDRFIKNFVATTLLNDLKDPSVPEAYSLLQNYPNPFNPETNISFSLKNSSFVSLKVFNLLGEEVASLVNGNMSQGIHSVNFDASDIHSGVYLYRLEASGIDGSSFTSVKKMILIK